MSVFTGVDTYKVQSPFLCFPVGEGETGEGDSHFRYPTILIGTGCRFPHCIKAIVFAPLRLPDAPSSSSFRTIGIPQQVALNTMRVDEEFVGSFVVAVGVEDDADKVIDKDPVAIGKGGAQPVNLRVVTERRCRDRCHRG